MCVTLSSSTSGKRSRWTGIRGSVLLYRVSEERTQIQFYASSFNPLIVDVSVDVGFRGFDPIYDESRSPLTLFRRWL